MVQCLSFLSWIIQPCPTPSTPVGMSFSRRVLLAICLPNTTGWCSLWNEGLNRLGIRLKCLKETIGWMVNLGVGLHFSFPASLAPENQKRAL